MAKLCTTASARQHLQGLVYRAVAARRVHGVNVLVEQNAGWSSRSNRTCVPDGVASLSVHIGGRGFRIDGRPSLDPVGRCAHFNRAGYCNRCSLRERRPQQEEMLAIYEGKVALMKNQHCDHSFFLVFAFTFAILSIYLFLCFSLQ